MEITKALVLYILTLQNEKPEEANEFMNSLTDKEMIVFGNMIKEIINDIPVEAHNDEMRQNIENMDANIATLEEVVVGKEIEEMMADIELDAAAKKRHESYSALKNELRKKILENPDSLEAKLLINHVIDTEKQHGLYVEDEWMEVLHLLM